MTTNLLNIDQREKVVLFIDGNALYLSAKLFERRIDYKRMFEYLRCQPNKNEDPQHYITNIHFYSALFDNDNGTGHGITQLLQWLSLNGAIVLAKEKQNQEILGRNYTYDSFHVEMTLDAIAAMPSSDHFIFFTSDPSYVPLFRHLRQAQKRVSLVSTLASKATPNVTDKPHASWEMRQSVSQFVELYTLLPYIIADKPAPVPA